jgi:hypothetical protein
MQSPDTQTLERIRTLVEAHFWTHGDFWIALSIGLAGLSFSILAYVEAKSAAIAAREAVKAVKLQSMSGDLIEVSQKLQAAKPGISFDEAKAIYSEALFKLQRAMAPFENDQGLRSQIEVVGAALEAAHGSLNSVLPSDPNEGNETSVSVYYGIEDKFSILNGQVGRLLGLVEQQTVEKRK